MRFHISTRAIAIGAVWGLAFLTVATRRPASAIGFEIAGGALVLAWLLVSAFGSCRCRIYTAVSRDELGSVYRRWTARKFLARVTPAIAEVQGVMEGNWAEAVEQRVERPGGATSTTAVRPVGTTRSWATDLLTASLLAAAVAGAVGLSTPSRGAQAVLSVCNLAEIAGAVAVIVQYSRGRLRPAMQRVAVITLIVMGSLLYARPFAAGVMSGIRRPGRPVSIEVDANGFPQGPPAIKQIEVGATALLGLISLAVVLKAEDDAG
jgi:hypothetical protein